MVFHYASVIQTLASDAHLDQKMYFRHTQGRIWGIAGVSTVPGIHYKNTLSLKFYFIPHYLFSNFYIQYFQSNNDNHCCRSFFNSFFVTLMSKFSLLAIIDSRLVKPCTITRVWLRILNTGNSVTSRPIISVLVIIILRLNSWQQLSKQSYRYKCNPSTE